MKIRCERGFLGIMCGVVLFLIVFFFGSAIDMYRSSFFGSAVVFGLSGLILISMCIYLMIAFCRTLEMNQEGCTISFLFFHRFYKWEDFAIKRLEDYRRCRFADRAYSEGIFFSLHSRKKPKWISAGHYMVRHPWSCFAIHFIPKEKVGFYRGHVETYEVDREFLVKRMQEWGVEIEGLKPPVKFEPLKV